jgi:penicillin-binding protein 1A
MVEMMRKMGVGSFLDPVPPLCVGSANISLYEMVAAYNTFPSKGMYTRPIFVTRIEDNMGNVLSTFTTTRKEAISDRTAYLMANLMQGVVNGGTAYSLRSRFGLEGEMAGKTGTTNDNADGWFIGYTPQLTAGAWAGFEDMQVHFVDLANGGGSASALPIWGYFMQSVRKDPSLAAYYNVDTFEAPGNFELNLNCDADALAEEVPEEVSEESVIEDEYEDEKESYGFE